jgi:hypothetical protein
MRFAELRAHEAKRPPRWRVFAMRRWKREGAEIRGVHEREVAEMFTGVYQASDVLRLAARRSPFLAAMRKDR